MSRMSTRRRIGLAEIRLYVARNDPGSTVHDAMLRGGARIGHAQALVRTLRTTPTSSTLVTAFTHVKEGVGAQQTKVGVQEFPARTR